MNAFSIICLILFISASITHLVFAFLEKEKIRKITKCTVLATLILFMISYQVKSPLLYIGVAFSLIGDALLIIPQDRKYFIAGACSFSVTHIFYIILIGILLPARFNWCYYGILIAAGYLFIEFVNRFFKKNFGKLAIPFTAYLYLLIVELISSFILLVSLPSLMSALIFVGVLSFLISDSILSYSEFNKLFKRHNFYLMIPYIIAQAFIVIGLATLLKK